jgi:hypothetical protein
MEIAKSEHEKKQLFYLSKNNLYEIGCQMAIKIRKHKVPFISDNEVVFLSPAEYVKVKITKV